MRPLILVGVVLLVFVLFVGHVFGSILNPVVDHPGVSVIDGDTMDFSGFRVRIIDIDAPELDTHRGILARDLVLDAVEHSDVVEARYCKGVDKYGRSLCLIFVDDTSVSDILLDAHLAREWK